MIEAFFISEGDGTHLLNLLQYVGPLQETMVSDCLAFTQMMITAEEHLGLSAVATYAGYLNHHYATVTFKDGSTRIYDVPVSSSTNILTRWPMLIP